MSQYTVNYGHIPIGESVKMFSKLSRYPVIMGILSATTSFQYRGSTKVRRSWNFHILCSYRWTIYDSWWEMRTYKAHLSFKCNGIKTDPSTHTYTHTIGQNMCSIFSIHLYRFIQLNALNFKSCPYFFRLYPLFQFIFLRFISAAIVYYLSDRQLRHDTPLYGTETAGNSARDW